VLFTSLAGAASAADSDFDGNGFDDLAIGIPDEAVGAVAGAGGVSVLYGSAAKITAAGDQFWHQNSAGIANASHADDSLGGALAYGDFDGDGFDDLAIGVPLESFAGAQFAGAVHVLYGTAGGLSATGSAFYHQNTNGLGTARAANEFFGAALAVGDFDGDGFDDLAMGAPGEMTEGIPNSGLVIVIHGSTNGLRPQDSQLWSESSPGMVGTALGQEFFGSSLATGDFNNDGRDDLAIGLPRDQVGAVEDAGSVAVLYGAANDGLTSLGNQLWNQASNNIPDDPEDGDLFGTTLTVGDFNGDGFDDLVVAAPYEKVTDAIGNEKHGAIHVIRGGANGLRAANNVYLHQDSAGVADVPENGDEFGAALAAGDANGDGFDDLVVGVPGEPQGGLLRAGALHAFLGSPAGITTTGARFLHQNSPGFTDDAEAEENFGAAISVGDFNGDGFADFVIGVPRETAPSGAFGGAVHVLYGGANGIRGAGSQLWHQDSPGVLDRAEGFDRFGGVLGQ